MNLEPDEQAILRGALVSSVDASCEECPLGLDLTQADFSVGVFAHSMIANCEQAGQVVYNYTGESPGDAATYEDMWKFTLVNYNAGGGCLRRGHYQYKAGGTGTNLGNCFSISHRRMFRRSGLCKRYKQITLQFFKSHRKIDGFLLFQKVSQIIHKY
ncbi:MAG: hypothetical protein IPO22_13540 [Anaerolineales bacterium]|nr:hypothetical protein [Anaerolineales bacterium]